jgi:hypothetical protein
MFDNGSIYHGQWNSRN